MRIDKATIKIMSKLLFYPAAPEKPVKLSAKLSQALEQRLPYSKKSADCGYWKTMARWIGCLPGFKQRCRYSNLGSL